MVALAAPAQADLSYTYIDLGGFWAEPPIEPEVGDDKVSLDEWGVGVGGSLAVHKYIHLYGSYRWGETTSSTAFVSTNPPITGRVNAQTDSVFAALGFNHRLLGDRSSVFFRFGGLYQQTMLTATIGSDPISGNLRKTGEEWGFGGQAGIRWMPPILSDRLEVSGSMLATNLNLTNNQVFFDIGALYDVLPWLALGANVNVGTDAFVGVGFGARMYWWKLVQQLRGQDPNQNFPWIKNDSSAPGGQTGGS